MITVARGMDGGREKGVNRDLGMGVEEVEGLSLREGDDRCDRG